MSDALVEVEFLTVEVVLALHQRQLGRFGGGAGLRDRGLLESAVAQPEERTSVQKDEAPRR